MIKEKTFPPGLIQMDVSDIDVSGVDLSGAKIPDVPQAQSTLDSAIQALQIVAGFLGLIFYILVVYRLIGYAAFDNLHRLYPFRILICIYTAIFAPVFIPYYLFRSFRAKLGLGGNPPRFISVFPIEVAPPKKGETPYDPTAPGNSAREFFFGWPKESDNRTVNNVKEDITGNIADKLQDYYKKLEDHVSDKPKPALNSTIQALLTGGGILFIGVIFSGLMYAIYQAFQPPPPPPTCTPEDEEEDSSEGMGKGKGKGKDKEEEGDDEEGDDEEEQSSSSPNFMGIGSSESMTDTPPTTSALAPAPASAPAPVDQAKGSKPELNKWNVLKALSFPALHIPQPQLSLSSLLPTTAVNFFQRL